LPESEKTPEEFEGRLGRLGRQANKDVLGNVGESNSNSSTHEFLGGDD
jgi:hypothetical protein